ncbi:DUF2079 domain-containing protein [Butyrivibrio sp. VCB2006]|uniref:DUF2079 domain-containing protein n=1 Tax=Butyrivibrio sp. VCB2006 TaxID=1280679 RepID=UPI000406DBB6|nr:DUF2079 domain-containing protein [Butyrivibrio sp. VCB2006]
MLNNKFLNSVIDQFLVLIGVFACFLGAVIYRQSIVGQSSSLAIALAVILVVSLLAYGINLAVNDKIQINKESIYELLLFILVLIARFPLFHYMQKYDGGIYWGAIYKCARNFEFSLDYIFENFKIWGHTTFMFSFFSIIGEFLTLGSSIGYCMVNTVMSAFAVLCIYRICREKLGIDNLASFLLCVTLQCVPIFWGTFSHVNPDYMLLIFFVYMWYTHIREKYILCFFWIFCMFQTKETGVVIVFGYALAYAITIMCHKHDNIGDKLISVIKDPFVITCFLIAITQGVIFLAQGDVLTWQLPDKESHKWIVGYSEVSQKGTDVNAFGVYPKYVVCKIVHMFSLNYSWIASLIIAFCIVYMYRQHLIEVTKWEVLIPLIGALVIFATFNSFYITYALYRYNVFFVVMLWLLCMILVHKTFPKRIVAIICNLCLLILLSIQTFCNTDVLSEYMFNKYPTGKGYLVATDMKKVMYGDNIINNYKYAYIDDLIDKMLSTIDYNDSMIAVFADDDSINRIDIFTQDSLKAECIYAGWDRGKKCRVVDDELGNDAIKINAISYSEMVTDFETDDKMYLLYYFDYSDLDNEKIKQDIDGRYNIKAEETLDNFGGEIHYLLLSKM